MPDLISVANKLFTQLTKGKTYIIKITQMPDFLCKRAASVSISELTQETPNTYIMPK